MEEETKQGFFINIWTSIKDFEKYEEFAADKVSRTIKYLLLLTLIFVFAITIAYTYRFHLYIQDVKSYVENNIEELSLIDGKLNVKTEEPIIIENKESAIPIIIIDTSEHVNINKLEEKASLYNNGIILVSNRVIISSELLSQNQTISYSNLIGQDINNKEEFINMISTKNMIYTYMIFFMTIFVYLFIVYLSSNAVDSIVLGALGFVFARIVRLKLKFKATFNIGVHALTLPIILNLIYIIVNTYSGFTVTYFGWMYTTISYIYVAVAILMIKAEIINQKIELTKINKIQEEKNENEEDNIEKEEKETKEDKKEKKENEEKDKTGEEPETNNA